MIVYSGKNVLNNGLQDLRYTNNIFQLNLQINEQYLIVSKINFKNVWHALNMLKVLERRWVDIKYFMGDRARGRKQREKEREGFVRYYWSLMHQTRRPRQYHICFNDAPKMRNNFFVHFCWFFFYLFQLWASLMTKSRN